MATKDPKSEAPLTSQRGMALMVVVVIMLLVSFLAAEIVLAVRTELRIATNEKKRTEGRLLAEAGISLGLFHLLDKPEQLVIEEDEDEEEFTEGRVFSEEVGSGLVEYYVVSETGKIDLNRLSPQLLELFLQYQGIEDEEVATIKDSLYDWRDTDNLHRINGAEEEYYEELNDPYIPRNGNIEDPSEFFLVRGADVLEGRFAAQDIFTVWSSQNKINFNSLNPMMLDFLVEGDQEKKEAYFEAKAEQKTLSQAMAMLILGDERFDELKLYLTYSAGSCRYFTIVASGTPDLTKAEAEAESEAETEEDQERAANRRWQTSIACVVKVQGTQHKIISWRQIDS